MGRSRCLWSVSLGLARGLESRGEYKRMMDHAHMPRQGDLDGRGNLSRRALAEFTAWFLKVCLDQVTFMTGLFALDTLVDRLRLLPSVAPGDRKPGCCLSACCSRERCRAATQLAPPASENAAPAISRNRVRWSGGPLCQRSCRPDRIGPFGGADIRKWLDMDRRTRIGSWRDCCRRRVRRWSRCLARLE